jgi:hypothetical protein
MQKTLGAAMSTKRMGGLGKLSDFGRTSTTNETPSEPQAEPPQKIPTETREKLVSVNIKITRTQQEWLADTARQVRENNNLPVPPAERVYPQHLIQVAIDLLQASGVDWSNIQNAEDLKKYLNI